MDSRRSPATRTPQQTRLRSGARVIVHQTPRRGPGASTVAIQLWIFAGTADEGPREHGCAHLLEHMVFKPLSIDGKRVDIASSIEALGGDVNAFTSHDETVFHATVPASAFDAALEALVRPVAHARPLASELAQEAQVVLEEIKQYDDDPGSRVVQEMVAALFGEHGYARPVLGCAHEVAAHTPAVLRRFLSRNYAGDRLALVVAGPLPSARVVAAARRVLSRFPTVAAPRRLRTPTPSREPHVVVVRDDVHEAHVAIGWQAPAWPGPQAVALELASCVLGYGESSWLARELRRGRGLVTDAHASLIAGRQGSTFTVAAHGPAARIEAATGAMLDMIGLLQRTPVLADELARARAVLSSDVVYRRETSNGLAHALGYYLSLGQGIDLDGRLLAMLQAQTPASLRDAAAVHLRPQGASIALVLPSSEFDAAQARALQRRLLSRLKGSAHATTGPQLTRDRHGIVCTQLRGGLRLRMRPDPSLAMLAGWMVWPGGQRIEPAALAGASPLMATLLTRGTDERDGDALAREIEGCAAVLDGVSGRNSVGLHFECLAPDRALLLRRLIECARVPRFADDELTNERRLAIEELAADRDDLAGLAFQAAAERLYGAHAYGRRRRGTPQTLAAVDRAALRKLWRTHYPVGRACLALCGDFDPAEIVDLLEGLEGDASAPPSRTRWPGPRPRLAERRSHRVRRSREQAHVVHAWPGLTLSDPRVWAMEVLTTVLGGQAGRLFAALREDEPLVYHVSASSSEGLDAGHVAFYAATSPDKLARTHAALERERRRVCGGDVRVDEVERAQAYLIGQAEAALQRRGRIASMMAFNEIYGLGYAAHHDYAARIEAVRVADLVQLARTLLRDDKQVTITVA